MKRMLGAAWAALLLVGVVVVPHTAHAATAPGPLVSLPFSTTSAAGPATGGSGTALVNDAVARRCNGGAPLAGQQWFTLPPGDLGQVLVRGQGLYWYGSSRGPSLFTSKLAVVDHVTGTVLACGGGPVRVTAAHSAAFVVHFDRAELDACSADPECSPAEVQVYANRTSGVPANDAITAPRTIPTVPWTEAADSGLADSDGPALLDTDCTPSLVDPQQQGTVWWRYSPAVSGDLPVTVDVARFGAPGDERVFPAAVGLLEVTGSGPVRVTRPLDDEGCESGPFPVKAGATYLVGVASVHDSYYTGPALVTGGPFTLRVGAPVASAPGGLSARPGDGRATVSWLAPTRPGSAATTSYRVRRFTGSGTSAVTTSVPATARSFTATGLTNGTSYRFDVTAMSAAGSGTPSALSAPVTPARTATAPATVAAAKDDAARTATVRWTPPASNGGAPVTGYRVARNGTDSGGTGAWSTVVAATTSSFTFRYLNAWDTYTLSVQAVNAAGTGPAATASAQLTAPTPSAPTGLSASRGNASARVTWAVPVSTGTSAVTGYRVRRFAGTTRTVQSTTTVAASARSLTVTGLTNGTAYSFDVTAVNAGGPGRPTARSAAVTPAAAPGAPAPGTATSGTAGGSVTATAAWSAPSSTGGSPITGYVVTARRLSSTGAVLSTTASAVQPATTRSLAMSLPVSGSYRFTVSARNAVGTSAASALSNLVTGR